MRTKFVLLAAPLLAGTSGAVALAQGAATYDPQQLPAVQGKVAQYSLNDRGDVDGLILEDGTEVHLPPHLGTQLVFAVRPGDAVTVRGLKARSLPLVQAMEVTADATGNTISDTGPAPARPMNVQGRVKAQLHGPEGDLNGVLLDDGTMVRLPPSEADRLAMSLAPGQTLYVEGDGVASPLGKVIAARAIGSNATQLARVAPKPGDRRGPPGGPPTLH
ncbi:MAG: hypothetical protein JWM77_1577 [Rhodospirillales bacterium]|nr:hypothetical protein [Rhodospirillales bacterium]